MFPELYYKKPVFDLSLLPTEDVISQDGKIVFKHDEHSYEHVDNGIYSSVSAMLDYYKPQFNGTTYSSEQSMFLDKQQVLEVWRKKGEYATNRGTFIHEYLELMLVKQNNPEYRLTISDLHLMMQPIPAELKEENKAYVKQMIEHLSNTLTVGFNKFHKYIKTEEICYSDKYKVAGRCDLHADKLVGDFKTNESDLEQCYGSIKFANVSLPNTKLNVYKLQIAIYAELMNKPLDCIGQIYHLRDSKLKVYNVEMSEYRKYAVMMMEDYVNRI